MQPALFDGFTETPLRDRKLPPYQRNSDTSKAAAERARAFCVPQGERLWRHIAACGECGCTDAEAEVALRMRRQSICARRNELMKAGRLVKTALRRSGCTVWMAVQP